jgi:hypothetical protein
VISFTIRRPRNDPRIAIRPEPIGSSAEDEERKQEEEGDRDRLRQRQIGLNLVIDLLRADVDAPEDDVRLVVEIVADPLCSVGLPRRGQRLQEAQDIGRAAVERHHRAAARGVERGDASDSGIGCDRIGNVPNLCPRDCAVHRLARTDEREHGGVWIGTGRMGQVVARHLALRARVLDRAPASGQTGGDRPAEESGDREEHDGDRENDLCAALGQIDERAKQRGYWI